MLIHEALVEESAAGTLETIDPPGVRDLGQLESAVNPHTRENKYGTVHTSGAALLHRLVLDHAFHNGNKRTATVATLVFLDRNGFRIDATDDELFNTVTAVASHTPLGDVPVSDRGKSEVRDDWEVHNLAAWLARNTRRTKAGREGLGTLKYDQLWKICAEHEIHRGKHRGNKITLYQEAPEKRSLKIRWDGSGKADVTRRDLKRLREKFGLTPADGITNDHLFDNPGVEGRRFIHEHQGLLQRLAKT